MTELDKFLSEVEENLKVYLVDFGHAEKLIAIVKELRGELKYISSGCLVPPDGGSPKLQDAIDSANSSLEKSNAIAKGDV